jgi:hypothetical protein
MVMHHGSFYAIVLGKESPIVAVCFDRENGVQGRDSGFMIVFSDAPPPGDSLEEGTTGVADLGCLIDEFPDLGVVLDLAREHGEVWRAEDGVWKPIDEIDDDELDRLQGSGE